MPAGNFGTAPHSKYQSLFEEFRSSGKTLQVYQDEKLLFSSDKEKLIPLLEYIEQMARHHQLVVIFDKIMGNAAALLSVKASCREIYSPLGSQLAITTLNKYRIKYHINEIIPCIKKPDGEVMCPMEELSINKDPDEFYEIITQSRQ
ncbi:MAG: DUF1893 domain-containing protein [Dehalococcoidales bacterium]|nr:MAG: DUF1893 domain-containing protein [Dehalococcoidales bacterium]